MDRAGEGYRFKYDKVRVAQSLTYQNDNLRPFAPQREGPGVHRAQHAWLGACDAWPDAQDIAKPLARRDRGGRRRGLPASHNRP